MKRLQTEHFKIDFNNTMIASIVSPSSTSMLVTAKFRSKTDFAGLIFHTEELMQHEDMKYPIEYDWTGTVLSFHVEYSGAACPFHNKNLLPSLTVKANDIDYYAILGFYASPANTSTTGSFTEPFGLGNVWVIPGSEIVSWTYVDPETEAVSSGTGQIGADYTIDYIEGTFYAVVGSSIPHGASLSISYTYSDVTSGNYVIDFDNLFQGAYPSEIVSIDSTYIQSIMFPIMPSNYELENTVYTGASNLATFSFTNWAVTNGDIGNEPENHRANYYKVTEGYDDTYVFNPKRLISTMYKLGYRDTVNLYVGASHYYEIIGTAGENASTWLTAELNTSKYINEAFETWFRYLCKAMLEYEFNRLIISMSMENLHTPLDWCQKMHDGTPGQTGWEPPTKFFSPVNTAVRAYYQGVCEKLLNIAVEEGFIPILQLGEPWWWPQSFEPGNVNQTAGWEGAPPCFYDKETTDAYYNDFGVEMPIYKSSFDIDVEKDAVTLEWLRDRLGDFSDFVKSIVKGYVDGQFTVMFFPPSVLSKETAEALKIVNVPYANWKFPALDFIQIEDYDWVVAQHPQHKTIYQFAADYFEYPRNKVEYFAGFVWEAYGSDFEKQWKLVENAARDGIVKKMSNVYIWAGTQIRRDSWVPTPFMHEIKGRYVEKNGSIYTIPNIYIVKYLKHSSTVDIVSGYNYVNKFDNGAIIHVNTSSAVSYNVILLETHTYGKGDTLYVTNDGDKGVAITFINSSWGITDLVPWHGIGEIYKVVYHGNFSWTAEKVASIGNDAKVGVIYKVNELYFEQGKFKVD